MFARIMADTPSKQERLAAKLRENLHRRKAQSRKVQQRDTAQSDDAARGPTLSKRDQDR